MKSGFVSVVGRPNVGKSTLTNAMVGDKVAITSSKPQTTRHTIRGIVNRPSGQLVLVDTPGVHRPRTLLGERLNAMVADAWSEVDVIVMCIPADELIGPGDRFIATQIAEMKRTPKVAVLTKIDSISKKLIGERLLAVQELGEELGIDWAHIVPVSAVEGNQVELLTDLLIEMLPEGASLYPEGEVTDEPEYIRIAELIREAALEGVHDELPHSIAVVVDEITYNEAHSKATVYVHMYVERDSQKSIVIGKGGSRLKEIGTNSRIEVQKLLGMPVHLDIRVSLAKDWQRDPKALDRLGF